MYDTVHGCEPLGESTSFLQNPMIHSNLLGPHWNVIEGDPRKGYDEDIRQDRQKDDPDEVYAESGPGR